MTPRGMSFLGFLASPASDVEDSKPTRISMAMVDWNSIAPRLCGNTMDMACGCAHWVACSGFFSRNMIASTLKPTSETSWMTLMAMARLVRAGDAAHGDEAHEPPRTPRRCSTCTAMGALMLNWHRM